MSARKPIRTTIAQAIDYWSKRVDECGLSVDWSEADTHCWRCGCERNLQRCHIVPDSLGGKDEPANIVLLCKRCHAEGPNLTDPEIMWDWIRAYAVPFYDTFWYMQGMREYEFIYKRKLEQEIAAILQQANVTEVDSSVRENYGKLMSQVMDEASVHFGQPYFNTATIAGILRMLLKRLAKEYNVTFPVAIEELV